MLHRDHWLVCCYVFYGGLVGLGWSARAQAVRFLEKDLATRYEPTWLIDAGGFGVVLKALHHPFRACLR